MCCCLMDKRDCKNGSRSEGKGRKRKRSLDGEIAVSSVRGVRRSAVATTNCRILRTGQWFTGDLVWSISHRPPPLPEGGGDMQCAYTGMQAIAAAQWKSKDEKTGEHLTQFAIRTRHRRRRTPIQNCTITAFASFARRRERMGGCANSDRRKVMTVRRKEGKYRRHYKAGS